MDGAISRRSRSESEPASPGRGIVARVLEHETLDEVAVYRAAGLERERTDSSDGAGSALAPASA